MTPYQVALAIYLRLTQTVTLPREVAGYEKAVSIVAAMAHELHEDDYDVIGCPVCDKRFSKPAASL